MKRKFLNDGGILLKKTAALMLVCILLTAMLAGCSNDRTPVADEEVSANFLPDSTAAATEDASATPEPTLPAAIDIPLEGPQDLPLEDAVLPNAAPSFADYSYATLTDTSFGFVFAYPTTWRNLPGKYTVCFQEQPSDGDFPARVAVTSKTLAHKPDSDTVLSQFQAYAKLIYDQYDPNTFEFGELDSSTTFMGKQACAITYLAYSGDIEIQGYMCCCAIDYTLYVFHFCSSYSDYEAMGSVMTRMRDSVTLVK